MDYNTSFDDPAILTTLLITLIFLSIIRLEWWVHEKAELMLPVCTTISLLVIYCSIFIFRPIKYKLTSNELIIHRLVNEVKINRTSITHLSLLNQQQHLKEIHSRNGVGGMLGYFGNFTNIKLSKITWYATRRDVAVLELPQTIEKLF